MRTSQVLAIIVLAFIVSSGCSLDRLRLLGHRSVGADDCQNCENEITGFAPRIHPLHNGWLRGKLTRPQPGTLNCQTCNQSVEVLIDGQCQACVESSNSTETSPVENISTLDAKRRRFNGRTRYRADRNFQGLKSIDESDYVDPSVPYGQFQSYRPRRGNRIAAALKMRRARVVTRMDSRGNALISGSSLESPSLDEFNVNTERERISEILEAATRQQYQADAGGNEGFAEKEIEIRPSDDLSSDDQQLPKVAADSSVEDQQKSVLEKSSVDPDPTASLEPVPSDQFADKSSGNETSPRVTDALLNRPVPHNGTMDSSPIIPDPLNRPAHLRRDSVIVLQAKPVERVNFNSMQQVTQNKLEIGPPPVVPVAALRAGQEPTQEPGIPTLSAANDQVQQALRLPTYSFRSLPDMQEVTNSPEGIPLGRIFDETTDQTRLSPPAVDHNPPALLVNPAANTTDAASSPILRLHAIPGNGPSPFNNASSSARIRFWQPSYEIRRPAEPQQIEERRAPLPGKQNARPIFDYDRIHTAIRGTTDASDDAATPAITFER